MNLSPQQDSAAREVQRWYSAQSAPVFRLFGYAGTGKTTLASLIAEDLSSKVRYAAFTGKAALMLRKRGCAEASTIHSLIYRPVQGANGSVRYELNRYGPLSEASLLVIDECSMVDEDLATDLLSFRVPIIALGDPAQLPPVKGAGYFTDAPADAMLTEIHRQVRDNPIIAMSIAVREGRPLTHGSYGDSRVITAAQANEDDLMKVDQVLVGRNVTRQRVNTKVRARHGREANRPVAGDRLVCLKNNHDRGLLNGGMWTAISSAENNGTYKIKVSSEDEDSRTEISVPEEFFSGKEATLDWRVRRKSDEFTFGYGLTVHKSQGSQWDDVFVIDESSFFREHARNHLYTAITRAAKRVTVVR